MRQTFAHNNRASRRHLCRLKLFVAKGVPLLSTQQTGASTFGIKNKNKNLYVSGRETKTQKIGGFLSKQVEDNCHLDGRGLASISRTGAQKEVI